MKPLPEPLQKVKALGIPVLVHIILHPRHRTRHHIKPVPQSAQENTGLNFSRPLIHNASHAMAVISDFGKETECGVVCNAILILARAASAEVACRFHQRLHRARHPRTEQATEGISHHKSQTFLHLHHLTILLLQMRLHLPICL